MNLFIPGEISTTFKDKEIKFITKTNYPADGKININLQLNSDEEFTIKIRNPKWNHHTTLLVNNEPINVANDYISITRKWSNNDNIELTLDMTTEIVRPIYYGSQMLYTDIDWGEGNHKLALDKQDEDAMRRIDEQMESFKRNMLGAYYNKTMHKDYYSTNYIWRADNTDELFNIFTRDDELLSSIKYSDLVNMSDDELKSDLGFNEELLKTLSYVKKEK